MFRRCRKFLLIALLPLLAACVNDGASYQIDGPQHSISIVRMQPHFWEERVDLHVVAQRMPECQRRYPLKSVTLDTSAIDLFAGDEGAYLLKQGARHYVIETRTCTGFQELKAAPEGGPGEKLGAFRDDGDGYIFVAQPAKAPAAVP